MMSGISESSVRGSLEPELSLIGDADLREKAVAAWTMACRIGGYDRLEDVPTEMYERHPSLSNLDHQKHTARIAKGILDALSPLAPADLCPDYVLTASLCHDVGKPCEWRNLQAGLYVGGTFYGPTPDMPQLEEGLHYQVARHSVWGFFIAMTVGMPLRVAHAIGAHSREGDGIQRSPEAALVTHADNIWWALVGNPRDTKSSHWREPGAPRAKQS
jgi:hypothetical protein